VDIEPHPQYCGDEFIQGDAIAYALEHAHEYYFIHASPPCQFGSTITPDPSQHMNLIPGTRRALLKSRRPYVIENVVSMQHKAPMRRDLLLCGEMFGLRVVRHRIFEMGGWLPRQLRHVEHRGPTRGAGRRSRGTYSTEGYYFPVYGNGGGKGDLADWSEAMDIDWMTDKKNLAEAIHPPIRNISPMNSWASRLRPERSGMGTDKRDECGCHEECEYTCEKSCIWPQCLTEAELAELLESITEDDF
jgi:DNA (cytosine-5)-methyltransferase 1